MSSWRDGVLLDPGGPVGPAGPAGANGYPVPLFVLDPTVVTQLGAPRMSNGAAFVASNQVDALNRPVIDIASPGGQVYPAFGFIPLLDSKGAVVQVDGDFVVEMEFGPSTCAHSGFGWNGADATPNCLAVARSQFSNQWDWYNNAALQNQGTYNPWVSDGTFLYARLWIRVRLDIASGKSTFTYSSSYGADIVQTGLNYGQTVRVVGLPNAAGKDVGLRITSACQVAKLVIYRG